MHNKGARSFKSSNMDVPSPFTSVQIAVEGQAIDRGPAAELQEPIPLGDPEDRPLHVQRTLQTRY